MSPNNYQLRYVLPRGGYTRTKNELTKSPKIYFWDLGLRNAIINNFDILLVRPDSGALFENFVITEVAKLNSYTNANYQLNY